jgi:N-acetylglucosamine-6-phosphate deacetylase
VKKLYINANIYNSDKKKFIFGSLLADGETISEVFWGEGQPSVDFDEMNDLGGAYLIPGLIDVHTHGRVGGDFNSADADTMVKMARSYLEKGVTGVMPTLASDTLDGLYSSIEKISDVKKQGGKNFLGVHLEGRYLNPAKRGAHAATLLASPNAMEIENLVKAMKKAGAAHVSAALELDTDGKFTETAIGEGATVGLAHTNANYAEAKTAIERGARSLTHLFNTMPPLHHRDGGAVAAGLTDKEVFCEIIADGFHIAPEMVKLAYMMKKDKLVLITDSMEATGMPDGEYSIAGLPVTVKDGKARTHEGAIAGSTLELIDGVRNLARFAEISFAEAIYNATAAPAKMIGVYNRIGSIEKGKTADMLVLDGEYNAMEVIFRGEKI